MKKIDDPKSGSVAAATSQLLLTSSYQYARRKRRPRTMCKIIGERLAAACLSMATICIAVSPLAVSAQSAAPRWKPERTVTMVVPFPAGGGSDAVARATARRLSELWGQSVIVENISGASGAIGSQRAAQAKPDGHTLLVQLPSVVLTKYLPGQKEFDPLPRLQPVSVILEYPNVIVSSGKVQATTWTEFVAQCKAKPACSFAAVDRVTRLFGLEINESLGLKHVAVVPYRGTSSMIPDLISDNVDFSIAGVTSALPHTKNGTVTVLATLGKTRASALPGVPTVAEVGMPQLTSISWVGVFAPKATSPHIVDAIAASVREAIKDPAVDEVIKVSGGTAVAGGPKELAELLAAEDRRLAALVDRYKIE